MVLLINSYLFNINAPYQVYILYDPYDIWLFYVGLAIEIEKTDTYSGTLIILLR